jgi:hypothetical protein
MIPATVDLALFEYPNFMSRKKRQRKKDKEEPVVDDSGNASVAFPSYLCLFVLATAAWLAYANSLNVPFIFDDISSIEKNDALRGLSLDPASWKAAAFSQKLPRPVAYLSFALNIATGGESVYSFHVTNTIIHIFCGWMVFALAMMIGPRLGGTFLQNNNLTFFAFSVAILFLLSPVQTQAVTRRSNANPKTIINVCHQMIMP